MWLFLQFSRQLCPGYAVDSLNEARAAEKWSSHRACIQRGTLILLYLYVYTHRFAHRYPII